MQCTSSCCCRLCCCRCHCPRRDDLVIDVNFYCCLLFDIVIVGRGSDGHICSNVRACVPSLSWLSFLSLLALFIVVVVAVSAVVVVVVVVVAISAAIAEVRTLDA